MQSGQAKPILRLKAFGNANTVCSESVHTQASEADYFANGQHHNRALIPAQHLALGNAPAQALQGVRTDCDNPLEPPPTVALAS